MWSTLSGLAPQRAAASSAAPWCRSTEAFVSLCSGLGFGIKGDTRPVRPWPAPLPGAPIGGRRRRKRQPLASPLRCPRAQTLDHLRVLADRCDHLAPVLVGDTLVDERIGVALVPLPRRALPAGWLRDLRSSGRETDLRDSTTNRAQERRDGRAIRAGSRPV